MAVVYLVRHGPAESRDPLRWPDDESRPLSREGVDETRKAAKGFARLGLDIHEVVSSPALRAKSTAELFHAAVKVETPLAFWEELRPDSPAAPVLGRVGASRRSDGILLVGHEPILSEFIGLALSGEAISTVHFARAGAAAVAFDRRVAPSAGRLDWLLTRSQLVALGRR